MKKHYLLPKAALIELCEENLIATSGNQVTYDVDNDKSDEWGASNRRIWDNTPEY